MPHERCTGDHEIAEQATLAAQVAVGLWSVGSVNMYSYLRMLLLCCTSKEPTAFDPLTRSAGAATRHARACIIHEGDERGTGWSAIRSRARSRGLSVSV